MKFVWWNLSHGTVGSYTQENLCLWRVVGTTFCSIGMWFSVFSSSLLFYVTFPLQLKDSEFTSAYNSLELFAYGTLRNYLGIFSYFKYHFKEFLLSVVTFVCSLFIVLIRKPRKLPGLIRSSINKTQASHIGHPSRSEQSDILWYHATATWYWEYSRAGRFDYWSHVFCKYMIRLTSFIFFFLNFYPSCITGVVEW